MRRVLVLSVVLVFALALSATAGAATPSAKTMAAQIRVLQKQVKTLRKQVKKLNTAVGQTQVVALVGLFYAGCTSAATADAFAATGLPGFAAPPNPVNDYSSCSDLSKITSTTIARQPGVQTVNVFQTLLNLFKPSTSGSPAFPRLYH